jgi:hypothetical protein
VQGRALRRSARAADNGRPADLVEHVEAEDDAIDEVEGVGCVASPTRCQQLRLIVAKQSKWEEVTLAQLSAAELQSRMRTGQRRALD